MMALQQDAQAFGIMAEHVAHAVVVDAGTPLLRPAGATLGLTVTRKRPNWLINTHGRTFRVSVLPARIAPPGESAHWRAVLKRAA